jgi:hypothetical protein
VYASIRRRCRSLFGGGSCCWLRAHVVAGVANSPGQLATAVVSAWGMEVARNTSSQRLGLAFALEPQFGSGVVCDPLFGGRSWRADPAKWCVCVAESLGGKHWQQLSVRVHLFQLRRAGFVIAVLRASRIVR